MSSTSVVTLPQSLPSARAAFLRPFGRPAKLILFAALGIAGAYGAFSQGAYITSTNSVVSAYLVELHAPIEGTLSGLPLAPGVLVKQGEVLARIDDPLADRQHLDSLDAEAEAEGSSADALLREQSALDAQRKGLMAQAAAHDAAASARLASQVGEAERLATAADATLAQSTLDLARGTQLHSAGILADAEYEHLRSAHEIAVAQAAAARDALSGVREQAAAAAHGIFVEPGQTMDVSYSRQRADEIALRMAENARALEASRAQARFDRNAAATEAERTARLQRSELISPISGMLWDLNATDGERAGAGDTVLTLVDCTRQFILARIPQDRVPDVALQATARYRLSGESLDRTGTVLSVTGADRKISARKLAASPAATPTQGQMATVLIAPDAAAGAPCAIGRTARVLIPTRPSHAASLWIHQRL